MSNQHSAQTKLNQFLKNPPAHTSRMQQLQQIAAEKANKRVEKAKANTKKEKERESSKKRSSTTKKLQKYTTLLLMNLLVMIMKRQPFLRKDQKPKRKQELIIMSL